MYILGQIFTSVEPVLNPGRVMYTHIRLDTPRYVMCITHPRLNTPSGVMCIAHHKNITLKNFS